jgi:Fibronectin type III domain
MVISTVLGHTQEGPTPPGPIAVFNVTEDHANVDWEPSVVADGSPIFYEIQLRRRIEDQPLDWFGSYTNVKHNFTFLNLARGTLYDVRVRAVANGTNSAWRVREEAFRTLGTPNRPPPQPARVFATLITATSARLQWSQLYDPEHQSIRFHAAYRVHRDDGWDGDWISLGEHATNSVIIEGLTPATRYDIRVRSTDGDRSSPWVVVQNGLVAFSPLSIERVHDGVLLHWPDTGAFVLESTPTLWNSRWSASVPNAPATNGIRYVRVPMRPGTTLFFRLRKP